MTTPAALGSQLVERLRRDERGEFVASFLVLVVGVLLVIGFTVDAGRLLAARRELNDTAAQAAIAGSHQIDGAAVLTGAAVVGPESVAAASAYLTALGVQGTVSVDGDTVRVEASSEFSPILFFGFGDQTVTGSGTARAVRGVDAAES